MILLACAVDTELAFLPPHDGVETLITGVGPVEAAASVAAALATRPYDLLINAGIAGAFDGAAQIGDGIVVATDTMEVDLEDGTAIALPHEERTIEEATSNATIVTALQAAGIAGLRGVTVARVTTTEDTARRLAARGAQVETMEGFAALRAAARAGVAAVEIRGISNRCGARERSGWNLDAGLAGLHRVTGVLFERLDGMKQF